MTQINSRLTTAEGNITILQTGVSNLEDEIELLKIKDTNLQNQIGDLNDRLRWMAIDGSEEQEG